MFEQFEPYGVVPILSVPTVETGIKACEALIAGELPIAEITFRTDAGAEAIKEVADRYPEMVIGAGTLLSPEDVKKARDNGAHFGVSPGCSRELIRSSIEEGLPFAPGVCSPSDIMCALEEGVTDLKYFPAEKSGGAKMLEALAAPFKHAGVRFCPTGGIKPSNMRQYLRLDTVPAVAGSWLGKRDRLENEEWDDITRLASEAVYTAR